MNRKLMVLGIVLAMAACKKSAPQATGDSGMTAEQEQLAKALTAMVGGGEPAEPQFEPGPMKEDVPVGDLGIKLNHPENVVLQVEGNVATLSAGTIFPTTVTVEKLTEENAVVSVEVNGVKQLGTGRSGSGTDLTIQTDCLLIRCEVATPDGFYESWKAEVGRGICESVDALPPPTAPAVTRVTNSRSTGGASCPEGYTAQADPFVQAVDTPEMREAFGKCWTDAVAANESWKDQTPRYTVGFDRERGVEDAPWFVKGDVSGLEGDTATFLECLTEAAKALEAHFPSEFPPEGCSLLGTAYVEFGSVVACP